MDDLTKSGFMFLIYTALQSDLHLSGNATAYHVDAAHNHCDFKFGSVIFSCEFFLSIPTLCLVILWLTL